MGREFRGPGVGIREFRENLASYIESPTPVAITRHGETVLFAPDTAWAKCENIFR